MPQTTSNRTIGWCLAFAGFASAIVLDPWSLSHEASATFALRQAQIATLTMAFFQMVVWLLATHFPALRAPARLTGVGSVLYASGWALGAFGVQVPLAPVGAIISGLGCAAMVWLLQADSRVPRVALGTMAGGMGLLALTSAWVLMPGLRLDYMGADDGLRFRLLRLAQIAAVALPSLALLLWEDAERKGRRTRWPVVMVWGAAGMPAVLSVAAFTLPVFKYLLPLSALAVFCAASHAAWERRGQPLGFAGWLVIAASMGVGLGMGLYAFDGPAPAPPHFAAYNDFVRRLSRLGHAYTILIGLLALFMEREKAGSGPRYGLLVSGGVVTVAASVFAAARMVPPAMLMIGPALVTAGIVAHFRERGVK